MSFENFLRNIKLVNGFIMRTRVMMHQNLKFRTFLEKNNVNPEAVLSDDGNLPILLMNDASASNLLNNDTSITPEFHETLRLMSLNLRAEQEKRAAIELELKILNIDNTRNLKRICELKAASKAEITKSQKRK